MVLVLVMVSILTVCNAATIPQREGCSLDMGTEPQPPRGVNTTSRLAALRKIMDGLDALIVTSDNEHQLEMPRRSELRREYISGFTGSKGVAIITLQKAALWVDGRYHLQAEGQVDGNWLVMKEGTPGVPSKAQWLHSQFPSGARIGADDKLVPASVWNNLQTELKNLNQDFVIVPTKRNLVDEIWVDRPLEIVKPAYVLDEFYTGKTWTNKVEEVRNELKNLSADGMVVTALDEVAWLLNVRGWDFLYSPYVKTYTILTQDDVVMYVNPISTRGNVSTFFEQNYPGQLKFRAYEDIWIDLPKYSQRLNRILTPSAYSYSGGASRKIYSSVPDEKRLFRPSPIVDLKATKNPVEIKRMRRSHIRDSAALCRVLQRLEQGIMSGEDWDELKVVEELKTFRSMQTDYASLSFPAIVGFGAHGALPHYMPTEATSSKIFKNSTMVIDSGGQYYGGTTDVTRTLHFGNATKEERGVYTRVLIGCIELSSLVFPENLHTTAMDVVARRALWKTGSDYPHGTGHGVGSFMEVHEAPIAIAYNGRPGLLRPGYVHSIEPGFYLAGRFGVRLENEVEVVKQIDLPAQPTSTYLGFRDVTLVPYDTNLIDFDLLNSRHRRWLNKYNRRIRKEVGRELKLQKDAVALEWLYKHTEHIPEKATFH